MSRVREYSNREELANTLSHSLGIVLGGIAACILLPKAYDSGNVWAVVSVVAYLIGMLSSYISSTLYHSCKNEKQKALYRKYDHAAIYLHIAGTNVPFFLIVLIQEPFWCWPVFAVVATTAVVGVISSMRGLKAHSNLETVCYVLMGTTILIAFKPLTDILNQMGSISAFYWLIVGGIAYIVGALFYSLAKVKYMHTVFHVFVLLGSICHIVAIDKIL